MPTVCVDVGGTQIKYGIMQKSGLVCIGEEATNAQQGGEAVVVKVAEIVRRFPSASAVGVSTAGEVDVGDGRIILSDNIPGYTGLFVRDMLAALTDLPVVIENDVNAAAIGEYAYGSACGTQNFIMLTYGTGVGGAIVQDGQLYRGAWGSAGEFGGIITHAEQWKKDCVGSGSYEQYASTQALVNTAQSVDAALLDGHSIMQQKNSPKVATLLREWLWEIALGLVGIIHCFNPQAVLLGGGIMQNADLVQRLHQILEPMLKQSFRAVRLIPAELGNKAALYGMAALVQLESDTKTQKYDCLK